MTGEHRHRVMDLLSAALAAEPAERALVLEELCGRDAALRQEVESLLELEEEADRFLGEPLVAAAKGTSPELEAGMRIGPYRMIDLIERGGMGSVYRAVREDDFEIEVAIKLIRQELIGTDAVRRFHAERQILARFEHPSIARLLDGGTTEAGTPYIVMEYVDGVAIDRYCEDHALPANQRLEIFRQVADAVAYAHQNLVVHRDLKPSNILVTESGVPKLLDFGVAKLLETGSGPVTLAGGAMTPRYASPEQLLGDPITAASDVYSLGVLLYGVLTGHLPCDLDVCDYQEIPQRILGRVPDRPSTLGKSLRHLAGDVDAIVLKALQKQPRQRYASVEQLSGDVRRYLEGRPVSARRSTWSYRAGKLVRRRKWGVAAVVLVLSLGVMSTYLWRRSEVERRRADRERTEAVRERTRAERVSEFLKDLFTAANPDENPGHTWTVREILDRGRDRLDVELDDEPETKAALTGTLGHVYRNLGLYDEALELMEGSAGLRRELYPQGHPDLVTIVNDLAGAHYYLGHWREAEIRFREALEMRRQLGQGPPAIARALANLASAVKPQGRYAEAGELYREALEIRERDLGADHPSVASSLYSLGALHYEQDLLGEAEPLLRRALEIRLDSLGERHTLVATLLNTLGRLLLASGELDEAEALQRRALAIRVELLGEDHAHVASLRKDLAEIFLYRGETAVAGELLSNALRVLRSSEVPTWVVADAESIYGAYLAASGHYEEAEPLVVSAFARILEARGETSIRTSQARSRAAALYEAWGKPGQAARYRNVTGPGETP